MERRVGIQARNIAAQSLVASMVFLCGCEKGPSEPNGPQPVGPRLSPSDLPAPPKRHFSISNALAIRAGKEAELRCRLEKNPYDAPTLLHLAGIVYGQFQLGGDEPDTLVKRSADYLRRAVAADPAIVEGEIYREIGKLIFCSEACVLSREENDEASLKSLWKALDAGWDDLDQLRAEPALSHVRRNPEFANIKHALLETFGKEVDELFDKEPDFTFDFDLQDTDGGPMTKQQFAGKILVVHVWNTWCPPCSGQIKDLIEAVDDYKEDGFAVVGLNKEFDSDSAEEDVNNAKATLGINFPCALASQEILDQIPHSIVPESLFFDGQGELKVFVRGRIQSDKFRMIIERLLVESPL